MELELSQQPISAVSEEGVGMRAATPCLFCAAKRSSQGNLNEASGKKGERASMCGKDLNGDIGKQS